jgi:predicted GNAT family acetyltransferase
MSDVKDNTENHRFELVRDPRAHIEYHRNGNRLTLIHTEVPEDLGGQGLGGVLVKGALEEARQQHLTIVPECSYARHWLETHQDAVGDVQVDFGGAH